MAGTGAGGTYMFGARGLRVRRGTDATAASDMADHAHVVILTRPAPRRPVHMHQRRHVRTGVMHELPWRCIRGNPVCTTSLCIAAALTDGSVISCHLVFDDYGTVYAASVAWGIAYDAL